MKRIIYITIIAMLVPFAGLAQAFNDDIFYVPRTNNNRVVEQQRAPAPAQATPAVRNGAREIVFIDSQTGAELFLDTDTVFLLSQMSDAVYEQEWLAEDEIADGEFANRINRFHRSETIVFEDPDFFFSEDWGSNITINVVHVDPFWWHRRPISPWGWHAGWYWGWYNPWAWHNPWIWHRPWGWHASWHWGWGWHNPWHSPWGWHAGWGWNHWCGWHGWHRPPVWGGNFAHSRYNVNRRSTSPDRFRNTAAAAPANLRGTAGTADNRTGIRTTTTADNRAGVRTTATTGTRNNPALVADNNRTREAAVTGGRGTTAVSGTRTENAAPNVGGRVTGTVERPAAGTTTRPAAGTTVRQPAAADGSRTVAPAAGNRTQQGTVSTTPRTTQQGTVNTAPRTTTQQGQGTTTTRPAANAPNRANPAVNQNNQQQNRNQQQAAPRTNQNNNNNRSTAPAQTAPSRSSAPSGGSFSAPSGGGRSSAPAGGSGGGGSRSGGSSGGGSGGRR